MRGAERGCREWKALRSQVSNPARPGGTPADDEHALSNFTHGQAFSTRAGFPDPGRHFLRPRTTQCDTGHSVAFIGAAISKRLTGASQARIRILGRPTARRSWLAVGRSLHRRHQTTPALLPPRPGAAEEDSGMILLINGSPKPNGNVHRMLEKVALETDETRETTKRFHLNEK